VPGGRHRTFRFVDRTELLAEFCLNTIAFTTRVPRQEDIGHDFFCVLSVPKDSKDNLVWAGPSFTVQVKSDTKPLIFEKPHELDWLRHLENPFFLLVGNLEDLAIEMYSTWQRLNGVLLKGAQRIVLKPGQPKGGHTAVWTADNASEQVICLGQPIIRGGNADIVNSGAGMYCVVGPSAHTTNEPPTADHLSFYWNAKNIDRCQTSFARSAVAVRLTLRNLVGPAGESCADRSERVSVLDSTLRAYWPDLDPLSQAALIDSLGQDWLSQ